MSLTDRIRELASNVLPSEMIENVMEDLKSISNPCGDKIRELMEKLKSKPC